MNSLAVNQLPGQGNLLRQFRPRNDSSIPGGVVSVQYRSQLFYLYPKKVRCDIEIALR